nr:uncharacterized protein LOC109416518 [Aedes albopictus]
MGRKCEFYWCGNHQGTSVSFHQFPQDNQLCHDWVQRCGSLEATQKFAAYGAAAFKNKRICSEHFPLTAFKESSRKEKGLLPNALPSLWRSNNNSEYGKECGGTSNTAGTEFVAESPQYSDDDPTSEPIEFLEGESDYQEWESYCKSSASVRDTSFVGNDVSTEGTSQLGTSLSHPTNSSFDDINTTLPISESILGFHTVSLQIDPVSSNYQISTLSSPSEINRMMTI